MLTEQERNEKNKQPIPSALIKRINMQECRKLNIKLPAAQSSAASTQHMPVDHDTVESHTTEELSQW